MDETLLQMAHTDIQYTFRAVSIVVRVSYSCHSEYIAKPTQEKSSVIHILAYIQQHVYGHTVVRQLVGNAIHQRSIKHLDGTDQKSADKKLGLYIF